MNAFKTHANAGYITSFRHPWPIAFVGPVPAIEIDSSVDYENIRPDFTICHFYADCAQLLFRVNDRRRKKTYREKREGRKLADNSSTDSTDSFFEVCSKSTEANIITVGLDV